MTLNVINHPIAKHLLSELRNKETKHARFREICKQITVFLIAEATKNLKTNTVIVETPNVACEGTKINQQIVIVPILRSGLTMLQQTIDLIPDVSVGYIGMQRDETVAIPTYYYKKLPIVKDKFVIVLDPMLATGGSAEQAIKYIMENDPANVVMVCIVAAPEGVRRLESSFPDVPVFTVALDERIDNRSFIIPGLGDFGDRAFDTM